jgi:DNA (cytosine-5)-methyltransferase 1
MRSLGGRIRLDPAGSGGFHAEGVTDIFRRTMTRRTPGPLTVLSVFTGAGGLDLGLERAGFETVACIELDERARDTIVRNRPNWNLQETGDVVQAAYELRPSDVGLARGELSVLAGGPPCQPFSTAAQWVDRGRAGVDDPRSLSLLAFLHLAETFLPHVILIENVPGFVMGRGSAVEIILDELGRINAHHGTEYSLDPRILDADDFGVPQRRRRAILVARRDGLAFAWPKPTHNNRRVRAWDALYDAKPKRLPIAKGQWSELLATIPAGLNYQYHTRNGGGQPLFGHRRWFWSFLLKLSPDKPSWTIPAQAGPATGPFHWDNRPLSTEELARLQTFPKSWKFEGGETAKRKQIGNATPPLLAEIIGRAIGQSVFGFVYHGRPTLSIPRRRTIGTAPAAIAIPVRFLTKLNAQEAHPGVGRGPGAARRQARRLIEQLVSGLQELHSRSVSETTSAAAAVYPEIAEGRPAVRECDAVPFEPTSQPSRPRDLDAVARRTPRRGSRASQAA